MTPDLAPRLPLPLASPATEPASSAKAMPADQVQIQPLNLDGAMQILIAELRAELPLPGAAPTPELPLGVAPHGGPLEPVLFAAGGLPLEPLAATAPQTLVQLFLRTLPPPESLEPAAWLASVMQIEGALPAALDRAVLAVATWHDVPPAVVEGTRETRNMVVAAITDDPPNPLWLRPEWLGLAPRMERYRRRRARARRWLSDPDPHWRERDEEPERKPTHER